MEPSIIQNPASKIDPLFLLPKSKIGLRPFQISNSKFLPHAVIN